MSRQKSETTIQKERDREIRRQRRELKRRERERRRAARELRRRVREEGIRMKSESHIENFTYAAVRNFHPIMFCESCRQFRRENFMATDTVCIACADGGETEKGNQIEGSSVGAQAPGQRKTKRPTPEASQPVNTTDNLNPSPLAVKRVGKGEHK